MNANPGAFMVYFRIAVGSCPLAVVPDASPSILLIITSNEVLRSRNFAFRPLEAFATTSSSADRQTPACLEDLLMTGTLTLSGILLLAVELGVAIDVCPPSACSVCHITLSASITIRKSPGQVSTFSCLYQNSLPSRCLSFQPCRACEHSIYC